MLLGTVLPLLVLQLVADVAVEHPGVKMVSLLAMASMGERSRMAAIGMVAEGKEGFNADVFPWLME